MGSKKIELRLILTRERVSCSPLSVLPERGPVRIYRKGLSPGRTIQICTPGELTRNLPGTYWVCSLPGSLRTRLGNRQIRAKKGKVQTSLPGICRVGDLPGSVFTQCPLGVPAINAAKYEMTYPVATGHCQHIATVFSGHFRELPRVSGHMYG